MTRWAARTATVGGVIQIGYGVLAWVYGYPAITGRFFEAVWACVNVGIIANVAVWLSLGVATRRLAGIGGGLTIAGHTIRIAIALIIIADPDTTADTPIALTVLLSFVGLGMLGAATLRAQRLRRREGCAPLLVLATGLVAVPFYSLDKTAHFILLGLLWGGTWMYMALVGYRHATAKAPTRPAPVPIEVA